MEDSNIDRKGEEDVHKEDGEEEDDSDEDEEEEDYGEEKAGKSKKYKEKYNDEVRTFPFVSFPNNPVWNDQVTSSIPEKKFEVFVRAPTQSDQEFLMDIVVITSIKPPHSSKREKENRVTLHLLVSCSLSAQFTMISTFRKSLAPWNN
jgi:hypothetical protein